MKINLSPRLIKNLPRLGGFLALVLSLPLAVHLTRSPGRVQTRAVEEGKVFLAFASGGGNLEKTVVRGEILVLPVILNTAGNDVFAVDAVIRFDPQFLEVLDLDPELPGVQVTPGVIFPRYFALGADNEKGEVRLSGSSFSGRVADVGQSFSGAGILGSISFRAKNRGTTKVYFDFQEGRTVDSNVVGGPDQERDLLETVGSANLRIQ